MTKQWYKRMSKTTNNQQNKEILLNKKHKKKNLSYFDREIETCFGGNNALNI